MTDDPPIDRRLTEIEIKISFTEDLLDQLNAIIVRQQDQIDLLIRELTDLRRQQPADDGSASRGLRDEMPPHY